MAFARRALALLALWWVVAGLDRAGLAVGLAAALAGAWLSLALWPAGGARANPLRLALFVLRLMGLAVLSGCGVARRALDPRVRIRPGLVPVQLALPRGEARDLFLTLMTIVPGTIPSGAGEDGLVMVHCLDTTQPLDAGFSEEEALFRRAIGA